MFVFRQFPVNKPRISFQIHLQVVVFHRVGDVITRTIAVTIRTKQIARTINARTEPSNALPAIALRLISVAMAIVIVAICQMKPIVHRDSQAVVIVPSHDSNAPIICAWPCQTYATAPTIVATTATKRHRFVRISIVTRCGASNVPIIGALPATRSAMAWTIAAMAVTRII